MAKKKPRFPKDGFKIIPDSIVKGKGDGHMYCQTEPKHPHCHKRKDRDACYVYYHQLLMENHIGRFLKDNEEVHHKDEDPSNNVLSNLELITHKDHARDHSKKKKFWKKSPRNKPGREAALRVVAAFRSIPVTE